MEIGFRLNNGGEVYIIEGDQDIFARITTMNINDKSVIQKDFTQFAKEVILDKLLSEISRFMKEHHPVFPIHQ